ncbi:MAG: molecular chaperone DnaJ [Frankiales bacterium]|jgi:Mce-associated membrane protein|nr:molecular chaperone DnaJ [Frankiales bacterium]
MTTPEHPDEQQPVEAVPPYEPGQPYEPTCEPVELAEPAPYEPVYEPVYEPATYEPVHEPEPVEPVEPVEPSLPEPVEPVEPLPVPPEPELRYDPVQPDPELRYDPVQPDPQPEPVQPEEPAPPPSLYDRLAQLEPDDDEPFFDEDPFDGDAPAEPAGYVPPAYTEQVVPPAQTLPAEPAAAHAELEPPVLPAVETEQTGATDPRRQRRARRGISLPVVALLLMTALMAAATTYLWLQVREHDRTEQARRTGLEASRDAARLLFSYDYRTLDKDFSTGRALTTGDFRKQYDKTTTKVVSDVAKQYKAVVKADVVSAGVVRATPEQVVTIVYVNQVTTSTRVTGEKVDLSRVKMTLAKVGGRWLVTAVNAL